MSKFLIYQNVFAVNVILYGATIIIQHWLLYLKNQAFYPITFTLQMSVGLLVIPHLLTEIIWRLYF